MDKKAYLIRTDTELWERFLDTIPRTKYTSINQALNDLIKDHVDFHEDCIKNVEMSR